MKCHRCGAPSEVLDTRTGVHGSVRRRRECLNEHRFVTLEVPLSAVRPERLRALAVQALAAAARWTRNLRIRRDTRSSRTVGAEYGLSHKQVQRVRAGYTR